MADLIAEALEKARQLRTGDTLYYKLGKFAFGIAGPPNAGPIGFTGYATFPLVTNPDQFEYSMPFAAEITPVQDGGVISEENGIVVAELTISGTTGFKLRHNWGEKSSARGDGEFTGYVDEGAPAINGYGDGLSGHLHFWRLATRCFDGYSALKKDPLHGPKTHMEFHSVKDDLHFKIVPRTFTVTRNASRERVTYRYNIRAAVVGPAEFSIEIPDPDDTVLGAIKDTISTIRKGVQTVQACVDDVTAAIDEISRTVSSVTSIIDDVSGVINSCTDLLTGTKQFLDVPAETLRALAGTVESAASLVAEADSFPEDMTQSFREMADAIDAITVAGRDHYRSELDATANRLADLQGAGKKNAALSSEAAELKAKADTAKGRVGVQEAFAGNYRAGDPEREKRAATGLQRLRTKRWRGFEERVVGQGDTVQSMAAKYIGDARDWMAIVVANQLESPYITTGPKIPGTVAEGEKLIVPIPESAAAPDTFTAGNKTLGRSQIEEQLGTDFELVKLADGSYGWKISESSGSTDCTHVAGVDNLTQGLLSRLRTVRGQNILYPKLGVKRVGVQATTENLADIQFESRRQVLADKRIKQLVSLNFSTDADAVSVRISVVPIGFTSNRVISRMLT